METIKVDIECSKELYELGKGLAVFVGAVKLALANGFQIGEDLPAIVTAAIANVIPAVDGVTKIGDEWKENKQATINAAMVTGSEIVGALTK